MGSLLALAREKDCPDRSSWVISTGVDFVFNRVTVLPAVSPIVTEPKVTVLGDTTRVPVSPPYTIFPPQLERASVKQQKNMMSRTAHQLLSLRIWTRLCA
jgi:hypothetical protein